jgi:hypothetical protein
MLPIDKPPTTSELETLSFSDLVFCLIKNREHRHLFVKEVWARITRDFDQKRLVEELARDPAIKAQVLRANPQSGPQATDAKPRAARRTDQRTDLLAFNDVASVSAQTAAQTSAQDSLSPSALLRDASGHFTPLTKSWDGEFPAWAICQAIRSTSWRGDGLKAYNPRDVLKFLDEMVERRIVSGFDSDDQERMLKSIVGKFNAWGVENLGLAVNLNHGF